MIARWIERRAERYLKSRGRVVLPRCFVGIAVGYGYVHKIDRLSAYLRPNDYLEFEVHLPPGSRTYWLNGTIVTDSSSSVLKHG